MNEKIYVGDIDVLPEWLVYPNGFLRMVNQNLINLTPWHIMEFHDSMERFSGLSARYPGHSLFPFAFRQDNDDLACWKRGAGDCVLVIHDFASSGWELEAEFDSFWSWFRSAVADTIDWD